MSIILKSYANIEFRFVVAVYSEALPIIEYYNLKLINYNHCVNKIYKNKNNNIWLILSGIGNKKAEKAVNSLYEISNLNHNALWINIGIAGHATFKPGQLYEIKKVIYIKNDKNFYYSNSLLNCFEMHECCSVDIQEKAFKDNYIYEMESYGFIKTVEKNSYVAYINSVNEMANELFDTIVEVKNILPEARFNRNVARKPVNTKPGSARTASLSGGNYIEQPGEFAETLQGKDDLTYGFFEQLVSIFNQYYFDIIDSRYLFEMDKPNFIFCKTI